MDPERCKKVTEVFTEEQRLILRSMVLSTVAAVYRDPSEFALKFRDDPTMEWEPLSIWLRKMRHLQALLGGNLDAVIRLGTSTGEQASIADMLDREACALTVRPWEEKK